MKLKDYIDPLNQSEFLAEEGTFYEAVSVAGSHDIRKKDLEAFDIVILGAPFNSENVYSYEQLRNIRHELSGLAFPFRDLSVADLGNLKRGRTFADSMTALKDVLNYLQTSGLFVILLGGPQQATLSCIDSLSAKNPIKMVEVDARFHLHAFWEFLPASLTDKFHYANVGNQNYYIPPSGKSWLESNHFEGYRLGEVRKRIQSIEPIVRDADYVRMSLNAMKFSEANGQTVSSPNGFYSEEFCQVARYVGAADFLKVASIADFKMDEASSLQTGQLIAQLIWFLIEGFNMRIPEYPSSSRDIKKFNVNPGKTYSPIIFYKSEKTGRWWMEVPVEQGQKETFILPSCYEDYQKACEQKIPERWLNALQKFNFSS